uniref:Retrotransposon gag domain-containing protein n=1 Tax=Paramormyrops kingsleyae TaxID=1676925 RepID=A0A3B3RZC6_9TELE
MALIGRVDEFNESREDFASYLERFELSMLANDIRDEKKVSVFLATIGPEVYGLLKNLVTPHRPAAMTYKQLAETLLSHYQPKPLVVAERYRFQKRNQKESESVSDYIVALRQLSKHCEYGDHLDEALRDRLVSGLISESIQRKLLTEKDLTFARACELAQSIELAWRKMVFKIGPFSCLPATQIRQKL